MANILPNKELPPQIPVMPQLRSRSSGGELEILRTRLRKTLNLQKYSASSSPKYRCWNLVHVRSHGFPVFYTIARAREVFLQKIPLNASPLLRQKHSSFLFAQHTLSLLRRVGTEWCLKDTSPIWVVSSEPLYAYIIAPERAESVCFPSGKGEVGCGFPRK